MIVRCVGRNGPRSGDPRYSPARIGIFAKSSSDFGGRPRVETLGSQSRSPPSRAGGSVTQRLCQLYVHIVWSTWDRAPVITPDVQAWIWPAIAEKARMLGSGRVQVGGMLDHVHVASELPATVALAEFVRHLKGASSALAGQRLGPGHLRWQGGYAAFTLRAAEMPVVEMYIRRQPEHHQGGTVDAQMEFTGGPVHGSGL